MRTSTLLCAVLAVISLAAAATFTWTAVNHIRERRALREDLAELSSVRYGALNADAWAAQVAPLLSSKIDTFDIKDLDQQKLAGSIERMLRQLIDNVKQSIVKKNAGKGGMMGALSGAMGDALIKQFVDFDEIHRQVPEYARMVLKSLQSGETKDAIRAYFKDMVAKGMVQAGGGVDMSQFNAVLQRNHCESASDCQKALEQRIRESEAAIWHAYVPALIASAAIFLLVWLGGLIRMPIGITLLIFACAVLLLGGVTAPMIELEAGISKITFRLMGADLSFSNQVLYFRSKSVWEVFRLLMEQGDFWSSVVGVLVVVFSIFLPAFKLTTSLLYAWGVVDPVKSRVVRFLVFESSKWSMADVMVVALFMAYVGFSTLVRHSLGDLSTNGTSLQAGFVFFLAFCIASMGLSAIIGSARPIRGSAADSVVPAR